MVAMVLEGLVDVVVARVVVAGVVVSAPAVVLKSPSNSCCVPHLSMATMTWPSGHPMGGTLNTGLVLQKLPRVAGSGSTCAARMRVSWV